MKILVTGGLGFVGKNLTKKLIQDNHEVSVVSNGSEAILSGIKKVYYTGLDGIDYFATKNKDVIFHLMANNDTLCSDRDEMFRINIGGPIKFFESAYKNGCRNFVYASSTAVYGNEQAPYSEATKISPLNCYGESKAKFDEFAMNFNKGKVSITGLRYCNIYGPGEESKGKRMSMIGQMMRKILDKEEIEIFQFGEQKRDWIFVDDIVDANIQAMDSNILECKSELYNIGYGKSYSFNYIVEVLEKIIRKKININYTHCSFKDSYQDHTECDIHKAKKELGFNPKFSLEEGMERYFNFLSS